MDMLRKFKLAHRLLAVNVIFLLSFLIYGGWAFKTLDELKVNGPLYQDIVQNKDLIGMALT